MSSQPFGYANFDQTDARTIHQKLVTITTHRDPETEEPGHTYGPLHAFHITGRPYLLLLPNKPTAATREQLTPKAMVFLTDVATVTVH